jgi:protein-tyrosine phosphatase
MIEIHSHILPGVDDGAKDLEESMAMIDMYVAEGVTDIIATPHYISKSEFDNSKVLEAYETLSKAIVAKGYKINLYLGNECYLDEGLVEQTDDDWYSLNHSRYVLVEFYYRMPISQILNLIYSLKLKEYVPIIAHAERLIQQVNPYEVITELVNNGCYIQINTSALTSKHKRQETKLVHKMFKYELVHFVASDAHNSRLRLPRLKMAYNIVRKKYGQLIADNVFIYNPQQIINNEIID